MHKRHLSPAMQRLIERCQQVNFGRVTLTVRGGEPDAATRWTLQRTVKLVGGENGPRQESALSDFELRGPHQALRASLASLPDGASVSIEVRHGLPFLMEVAHEEQAA